MLFEGKCGIVLWFLGLLELIKMHTQCPLDSQASSVAFLGKLCNYSLALLGVLFCFVTLAVQVALLPIMGQCDQQFTTCVGSSVLLVTLATGGQVLVYG